MPHPLFQVRPQLLLGQESGRTAGHTEDTDILMSGIAVLSSGEGGPFGILNPPGDYVDAVSQPPKGQGKLLDVDKLSAEIRMLSPSEITGIEVSLWIQTGNEHDKCKNAEKPLTSLQ